jgi:hypothetical protein
MLKYADVMIFKAAAAAAGMRAAAGIPADIGTVMTVAEAATPARRLAVCVLERQTQSVCVCVCVCVCVREKEREREREREYVCKREREAETRVRECERDGVSYPVSAVQATTEGQAAATAGAVAIGMSFRICCLMP